MRVSSLSHAAPMAPNATIEMYITRNKKQEKHNDDDDDRRDDEKNDHKHDDKDDDCELSS